MIKRLKRRFVIVNMIILTCMLFGILASVFFMMYSSEVNKSYEIMENVLSRNRFGKDGPIRDDFFERDDVPPDIRDRFDKDKKPDNKLEPAPFKDVEKSSYIYAEFNSIDNIGNIVYQHFTTENDESVKEAVKQIYNKNKEQGFITIADNKYRYIFRFEPPKNNYSVVILDVTDEVSTVNRLLFIFIIIAGVGIAVIFLISILLAKWTTKPVEKAWTQQKEFIANASHELKTPLTVISTNTEVILSSPDDTVRNQRKWLGYIKDETDRMSKLVNSLLYIAKYDANRVKLVYSTIDFSDLLSGIALQFEPLAFERGKTLETDIDDNIKISGDVDKIKQVINILLDNALKYSTENGSIKIKLKKNKNVSVTISNSSEDIPKAHIEKLFDRFYRIDDSRNRKTGGTGLGLNIAKTIVESHKGTITAQNKDKITSFTVTFNNPQEK